MRLIHLIDNVIAPPCPTTLRLLAMARRQAPEGEVWALGPRSLVRSAHASGLHVDRHLTVAPRRLPVAALAFARQLRRTGRPETIATWSAAGAALAAMIRPSAHRLATIAHLPDAPRRAGWIWSLLRRRPPTFAALSETVRDRLMLKGMPPGRIHRLDPAYDDEAARATDRNARRMRWGVTDAETFLVAAVGDPPRRIDAMEALLAVGLAAETGRDLRLLIGPRAAGLRSARHVARQTGREQILIEDAAADHPWSVLPACDAALALSPGLSVGWAMAAGLPILAPDTDPLSEQLAGSGAAALARPVSAGELARCLLRLHDEPASARQLAAAGRRWIEPRTRPADFADRFAQLARPNRTPQPAAAEQMA